MTTFCWTGPENWLDTAALSLAIASLRKPFRSLLDGSAFSCLVWELLASHGLPRVRYGDGLEANLTRLSRLTKPNPGYGFLMVAGTAPLSGRLQRSCLNLGIQEWRIN